MKLSILYICLLFIVAVWVLMLFIPPLIAYNEAPSTDLSRYFYKPFSMICHQYESRSFHIFGYKLAVCARCTGIYFGFLIGMIWIIFILLKLKYSATTLWIIALCPMMIDILLDSLGIHHATLISRFITGFIFGFFGGIILTPLIMEACIESFFKNKITGVNYEPKT